MLNNELSVPVPNIGFTMHSEDVLGEMADRDPSVVRSQLF